MKRFFLFFLIVSRGFPSLLLNFEDLACQQKIVLSTKKIEFEAFPNAFNPSVLKIDRGILMSFRYCPNPDFDPWESYIGVVLLNDAFEPIIQPQLLNTRSRYSKTTSHAEDARLFSYRGRIFLIYNDNMEVNEMHYSDCRDMHIIELFFHNDQFTTSAPLKLKHIEKSHCFWQKNWTPFEWNKKLLISYTMNPHEILYANLQTGSCYPYCTTEGSFNWDLGPLRGGVPPQIVDGEFLSFFHSSLITSSDVSQGRDLYHYFMGAYTFSPTPPFEITRISALPIIAKDFYTQSEYIKRVIFPGGFVVADPYIYLAYGKDDYEIWIATLDKEELKKALL